MYLFTYIYVSHIAEKNYHISSVSQPVNQESARKSAQPVHEASQKAASSQAASQGMKFPV
ncbi:hypothetical protein [Nostoc sp.]|uniref:hypothetical protein n=1 Tax=Nostoc sp. TaxID=1180 RepID=UPI002FF8A5D7